MVGFFLFSKNMRDRTNKNKKTVTRTFRIKKEWDNILQEEAETLGVSVNVLVNRILRRYALFHRWADKSRVISVPKRCFQGILNSVPEENLAVAGKRCGSSYVVDTINMMGLKMNYNSFTFFLSEYLGAPDFARWFQCFRHELGGKEILHMQHDLGRKWSIYLEQCILSSLKALTNVKAQTRIYEYAVNLKVEVYN